MPSNGPTRCWREPTPMPRGLSHPRPTPEGRAQHAPNALTCGYNSRAMRAGCRFPGRALGPRRGGGGLGADHGHAVEVREVREVPRPAPPLRGTAQGTGPGKARTVVHLPVLREAYGEPANAHLLAPVRLPQAESSAEAAPAGRGAETQAEGRRRPQAGTGEGAQAEGGRAPEEARRRGRRQARRKRERSQSHDRNRHEYAACTDPYCPKFQCRVYREGLEAGRAQGHAAGFAEGYAEGMNAALQSQ